MYLRWLQLPIVIALQIANCPTVPHPKTQTTSPCVISACSAAW
jgi:hypothetical protein